MTQKKSYSRFFIILQENEKGYALSSDKLPTGYAKLEMKNDKCKVSFYVQNLKKEMQPYYMVLICNKKDVKKLIKIGNMNIDDNGRMESSFEYPIDNLAGSSMTMDKVVGAAIVKFADSKIVDVMSGFASKEIPEWKEYDILDDDKNVEEPMDEVEKVVMNTEDKDIDENVDSNNIFDKYEESIERAKDVSTVISDSKTESMDKNVTSETYKLNPEANVEIRAEADISGNTETNVIDDTEVKSKDRVESDGSDNSKVNATETSEVKAENVDMAADTRKHKKAEYGCEQCQNNIGNSEHKIDSDELPKGNSGMFFKHLVKEFEETSNVCSEIKKCRWFKVPIKSMNCLYDTSDYDKYSVLYYPMIMHYEYIKKHRHFLTGLKYDANGEMKYLVYGILGSKSLVDQPFGGSTGFVTWAPLKESMETKGLGYWLMFYDFKDSSIVIPMK